MKIIHIIYILLSLVYATTSKNVVIEETSISFDIEEKFGEVYSIEKSSRVTGYEYDSRGNQNKVIWYNTDGTISQLRKEKYDVNNNLVDASVYNSDGSRTLWVTTAYDSTNNKIRFTNYTRGIDIIYTYDSNNNMISETEDSGTGNTDHYVYDSRNNMIESYTTYFWEKGKKKKYIIRYEYNSKNLLVAKYGIDDQGLKRSSTTFYEYNDNDSLIYRKFVDLDNITTYETKRKFDRKGNLIESISINHITQYRREISKHTIAYDRRNNYIEKLFYDCSSDNDCEITQRRNYKYDSNGSMIEELVYKYKSEFGERTEYLENKAQWKHKYKRIRIQ